MVWQVLYVNSRAESKVAERIEGKGINVFCPMKTMVKQWSDRKKKVCEPYFRSYVFVRVEKEKRLDILQTPGVVGFLYWLGKPAVIRETEMEEVIGFFENRPLENIVCKTFDPGESLLINAGPLQNKKGVVLRQSKHKVVLQIQQLGIALTAEIPKDKVALAK